MVSSDEILAVVARDIGYHEGSGKSNKFGEWYGMNGVAWCMQAVQYWYHEAGLDLPLKTASCGALLRWYQENQPECITKEPIRGCIVIFDFPGTAYSTDHTGLFVKLDGDYVTTIDGNTSNGNDANGGWVQQRARKLSYANPKYIIPKGLVEVDINKLIDEMTPEQAYRLMEKAEIHANTIPAPSWAVGELAEAVEDGITDGSYPMRYAKRFEAAIMVKRAMK